MGYSYDFDCSYGDNQSNSKISLFRGSSLRKEFQYVSRSKRTTQFRRLHGNARDAKCLSYI